jgi:hypothetical protein
MLASDTKLDAPAQIFDLGKPALVIVDTHVQEMHASLIGMVVPPDVRQGTVGLNYDSDAMQLGMTGMEDMSRHSR